MKRLIPLFLILPLVLSCAQQSDLPPEQVMRNMIIANREMRSAHFLGTASFSGIPILPLGINDGEVRWEGDMQDAGRQLQFSLALSGNQAEDATSSMRIAADIIVLDSTEVYLRLDDLSLKEDATTDPASQLTSLLGNTWWSLTPQSARDGAALSPDPRYLRMQAETVRVEKNRGITTLNGRDVFLYDVTIDPEAYRSFMTSLSTSSGSQLMKSASGTALQIPQGEGSLWIDTQTFLLQRAQWNIRLNDDAQLRMDITFSKQQEPVTILPPPGPLPFPVNGSDAFLLTD